MTCRMAAGQQKKRLTNSSLPDQYRPKKKPKFDSPDSLLVNLNSHIHLKWDEPSKRVIPSKEQIGIPWSHLAPFIDSPSPWNKRPSALPDVTCVPRDIFALENLTGVLSYEVWVTCLTEAERKFLTQFLPTGTNADEVVHLLLTGKNHHFGNPFLSWSSSLCYGDLHPDAILNKEQQIRDDEKACRAELNNYHSNMVDILKKWKEKWLTCDNPETLFRDNPAKQKRRDLQSPRENIIFSNAPKKETAMKVLRNGDVSQFMSYIKISRSQHDLVKRIKQSGDGIQTKHLARVIGDIDNFHVKPYETLVEDEKKRLHNHWAILSCKDLPAALEARRDRKLMIENLRTSLCLELAEKNTSVVEKAEQVADRTADVGQDGAYQNGDLSDGQEELVEHSPQGVLQTGNDSSTVLDDEDVKDTTDTYRSFRSHDSPNMKDQDVMHIDNTNITTRSQNSSDEQDQDLKNISCTNTSTDSGNSSDKKDEDIEDIRYRNGISQSSTSPGVEDEDMKDTSCKDTTLQDHNIPDIQAQEPDAISHGATPIQGLNSPNMLVQDLKNSSYTGLSIHGHAGSDEQNDDLKNISYPRASTGHDMNDIPSSNSNQRMDHMVVDQKEAESIAIIPSDSALLFLKPLSQQKDVEEGPELKEPAEKCEKDLWQSASSVESFYRPPEKNSLYTQSGDLQLKHHLSGGQATSMIDLGRDARSRQQAQVTITAALPLGNAASLLQPCTNQQNNQQLQIRAMGMGMAPSYSLGHVNVIKQSIDLHSMTNDRLGQSALVCSPLQEQMQLLDQSHSGLYLQQLPKNLYSGAGPCTQETFPMVEQQNFAGHAAVDRSCNWFHDELPPHNNWSGMESDGIAAQDMPEGSSADGSLFSVLSQYKQASPRMQLGAASSDQSLERRNLVPPAAAQDVLVPRAENIVSPCPNMYGYIHNLASNPPSSGVDVSVNNLQWANLAQESHGMPDPCFRQFGGPWSR